LQVPFLNLLTNIQQRAGQVNIRLGGGIVDFASLVDDLGSDQTEAVLFGTANTVSFNATNTLLFLPSYSSLFLRITSNLAFGDPCCSPLGFFYASQPPLVFTPGLLYTLSNVSALLNVRWYMGTS